MKFIEISRGFTEHFPFRNIGTLTEWKFKWTVWKNPRRKKRPVQILSAELLKTLSKCRKKCTKNAEFLHSGAIWNVISLSLEDWQWAFWLQFSCISTAKIPALTCKWTLKNIKAWNVAMKLRWWLKNAAKFLQPFKFFVSQPQFSTLAILMQINLISCASDF